MVHQGGDEKEREPDKAVRALLLETLLLFCSSRSGREELRKRKAYPVVREVDVVEDDEENSEIIYKIVNFLQRDETNPAADINVKVDADAPVVPRPAVVMNTPNTMDALD